MGSNPIIRALMEKAKDSQIEKIINQGTRTVIDKNHLRSILKSKKIIVKYGVDPTSADIHLGHLVCLLKLKQFQELGHQIIFLIGDYTAKIGDPSGANKTRPMLSDEEIKKNVKTYVNQVKAILDTSKIKIEFNSRWLKKLDYSQIIKLTSHFTVARILERDDFWMRFKNKKSIGLHELLYPVMQAYDSVVLKADLELGGEDQTFNFLAGRHLMTELRMTPQDIMTMPLLIGLDGQKKMSKSLGNYIGISEPPEIQFGKIMSLPDHLIIDYFRLLTTLEPEIIDQYEKELKTQRVNPRDLKEELAYQIVKICHNEKKARKAKEEFNRVFKNRQLPSRVPTLQIKKDQNNVIEIMMSSNLIKSKSEAKRLIIEGAVEILRKDQKILIADWSKPVKFLPGDVLKIGKKNFLKIKLNSL